MRIGILGAGNIGCYIGGRLRAAGADVVFIGRAGIREALTRHGLHFTDYRGGDIRITPDKLTIGTTPEALTDCDFVLVTVKSQATATAAEAARKHLRPGAVVISLQNGVRNAEILRQVLPEQPVFAGMVPFNVIVLGEGRFHQGTEGALEIEANPALLPLVKALRRAGLPSVLRPDIQPVQWAKLILNLNNAINALANIPLRQQLAERDFRRCLALAQREALALLKAEGRIRPARLTPLPPDMIPTVLELPDLFFRLVAGRMLRIDPLARSSMSDDLAAGREPEAEALNGEVIRLARRLGREAPVNARLCELVMEAHRAKERPSWRGAELLATLSSPEN